MTVLAQYDRLECAGVWHPAPDDQRRDVYVVLGDATLVIQDGTGTALSHWSLPAVTRLNPGKRPASYAPGPGAEERLELNDDEMIAAIHQVGQAIARARPRPGRVRQAVVALTLLAMGALAIWWLPGALARHTAGVLPPALKDQIGQDLLTALAPIAGQPCRDPDGAAALSRLSTQVLGPDWRVEIVPDAPTPSAHLPGRTLVLDRALVTEQPGPMPAAGAMVAEATRARGDDPLARLLDRAGPMASLRLLTTGVLPEPALRSMAETVFLTAPDAAGPERMAQAFRDASIPTAPYAQAVPDAALSAVSVPAPATPLLSDAQWLRLRQICGD